LLVIDCSGENENKNLLGANTVVGLVPKNHPGDPRVRHLSRMVLQRHHSVGMVNWHYVVTRMVMTCMVISIRVATIIIIIICMLLLCRLPLIIFLIFHSTILEPYFDLSLGQI